MPVKACSVNGKSGFKWGDSGTCYTHDGSDAGKKAAKQKAIKQALAIGGGSMPKENAEAPWWLPGSADTTKRGGDSPAAA